MATGSMKSYSDGSKVGKQSSFDKDGLPNGRQEGYDQSGSIIYRFNYLHGRRIGFKGFGMKVVNWDREYIC